VGALRSIGLKVGGGGLHTSSDAGEPATHGPSHPPRTMMPVAATGGGASAVDGQSQVIREAVTRLVATGRLRADSTWEQESRPQPFTKLGDFNHEVVKACAAMGGTFKRSPEESKVAREAIEELLGSRGVRFMQSWSTRRGTLRHVFKNLVIALRPIASVYGQPAISAPPASASAAAPFPSTNPLALVAAPMETDEEAAAVMGQEALAQKVARTLGGVCEVLSLTSFIHPPTRPPTLPPPSDRHAHAAAALHLCGDRGRLCHGGRDGCGGWEQRRRGVRGV
jgi:hypothetical protein